jgi:hypothetical protein
MDLVAYPTLALALVTDAHLGIYNAEDAIFRYPSPQPRTNIFFVCLLLIGIFLRPRILFAFVLLGGRPRFFGPFGGGPSSTSSETILESSAVASFAAGVVLLARSTNESAALASATISFRCSARAFRSLQSMLWGFSGASGSKYQESLSPSWALLVGVNPKAPSSFLMPPRIRA